MPKRAYGQNPKERVNLHYNSLIKKFGQAQRPLAEEFLRAHISIKLKAKAELKKRVIKLAEEMKTTPLEVLMEFPGKVIELRDAVLDLAEKDRIRLCAKFALDRSGIKDEISRSKVQKILSSIPLTPEGRELIVSDERISGILGSRGKEFSSYFKQLSRHLDRIGNDYDSKVSKS